LEESLRLSGNGEYPPASNGGGFGVATPVPTQLRLVLDSTKNIFPLTLGVGTNVALIAKGGFTAGQRITIVLPLGSSVSNNNNDTPNVDPTAGMIMLQNSAVPYILSQQAGRVFYLDLMYVGPDWYQPEPK
jgi:hypothetical protein